MNAVTLENLDKEIINAAVVDPTTIEGSVYI